MLLQFVLVVNCPVDGDRRVFPDGENEALCKYFMLRFCCVAIYRLLP